MSKREIIIVFIVCLIVGCISGYFGYDQAKMIFRTDNTIPQYMIHSLLSVLTMSISFCCIVTDLYIFLNFSDLD
jgi:hypothetical protein